MFLVDKYNPETIDEAKFHLDLLHRLKHMSKHESIPHMLFCGPNGCGKKTIIRLLLEMLFDKDVHKVDDSVYTVIGSGNKATPVTVKQSNYHIVIEPNNNNFDRYLIQDIVKEYARKMPMSIFKTKKIFKIVLINNVDNLTYYAQTSLRRTMEKYSSICRFIMCCTCSSRVIEPLISRCIFFTINSPTNDQLFSYIYEISKKEEIYIDIEDYTCILDSAEGNIKDALWLLELYRFKYNKTNIYHHTIDLLVKIIISHNLEQINSNEDKIIKNNKYFVRDLLYNIMITNISGTRIFRDILNKLCNNRDIPDECKYEIIHYIAHFEHNLVKGRRNIMHLEPAVINIMNILYNYVKINPEYEHIFKKYTTTHDDQIIVAKGRKTTRPRKSVLNK